MLIDEQIKIKGEEGLVNMKKLIKEVKVSKVKSTSKTIPTTDQFLCQQIEAIKQCNNSCVSVSRIPLC